MLVSDGTAEGGGVPGPEDVLRPEVVSSTDLIRQVYGVWSEVATHPLTGKLTINFFPEELGKRLNRKHTKG